MHARASLILAVIALGLGSQARAQIVFSAPVGITQNASDLSTLGGYVDATIGIPPAVTEETEVFWKAAKEGRLVVERCLVCGADTFPPRGMCRYCRARPMGVVEITGPGHVYSFTVNHQRWLPDLEVPYIIVLVEFEDHPGVRVVGRLRGRAPEDVVIGMGVDVGFEPGPGGYAIPSFTALDDGEGA